MKMHAHSTNEGALRVERSSERKAHAITNAPAAAISVDKTTHALTGISGGGDGHRSV